MSKQVEVYISGPRLGLRLAALALFIVCVASTTSPKIAFAESTATAPSLVKKSDNETQSADVKSVSVVASEVASDVDNEEERLLKLEKDLLNQLSSSNGEVSAKDDISAKQAAKQKDTSDETESPVMASARIPGKSSGHDLAKSTSSSNKASRKKDSETNDSLVTNIKQQLESSSQNLSKLQENNVKLVGELESSKRLQSNLRKELEEVHNRLIIAETEVERLNRLLEARNRATLARFGSTNKVLSGSPGNTRIGSNSVADKSQLARVSPQVKLVSQESSSKATNDMLIATVTAKKAYLRSGPGKDNSPLMSVTSGTRLVIETRKGEWYRVIAPSGTRAWVASEVLAFGPEHNSSPTETISIRGFDRGLEDEALQHIRNLQRN